MATNDTPSSDWAAAGAEITTMLLSGAAEEDVLRRVVHVTKGIAAADAAALVLPGLHGELTAEIVEGDGAAPLVGLTLPREGMSWHALRTGRGHLVESLATKRDLRTQEMRAYGPALYAPLGTVEQPVGVLVLFRTIGAALFTSEDLQRAQIFANQAALALVLAESRQAQAVADLVRERERIARDLHDLVIQQLFATGMQLSEVRRAASRGLPTAALLTVVDSALNSVDAAVHEIREVVHSLRDPDDATGVVERLRRESSLARSGLGFAPSLVITLDGRSVTDSPRDEETVTSLVSDSFEDDVVAVVREGLANTARHAHASSVTARISLDSNSRTLDIEVIDDGVGLAQASGRKSGTWNIAARARQHRGTSSVADVPHGHGTILRWSAPLP